MPSPIEQPSFFRKTPALRLSLLFLLGILIAHWSGLSFTLALPILLALLIASLFPKRGRDKILVVTMVFAGILSYDLRKPVVPLITRFSGRWVCVDGMICAERQEIGDKLQFELEVEQLHDKGATYELSAKILVRSDETHLDYGNRIRATGLLLLPHSRKNPGEFDYRAYLQRRGIACILSCGPGAITLLSTDGNGNPFVRKVILPLRQFVRRSYSRTLSGETRAFVEGITLGEKERLSASTRGLFSKTGIYHILAVSGLHVGIVAFIIFTLLGIFRVPWKWVTPIVIGALVIYGFVTHLRPSVVRATIMMAVVLIGRATERNVSLLNLLGVALLIIMLFDPLSPFDLSFQLSFAATASIVLILERLRITKSTFLRRWFCLPILISLAAQAGTAPIVAYHFFRLPLLTAIANLFVIPAVTISIALAFISSLSTVISLEISRMLAAANWLVIQLVFRFVRAFGSLRYADIVTGKPPVQFIVAYFLIFGLVLHLKRVWIRKVLIFTILIVANLCAWQKVFASMPLRVTFLSVEGSACIVKTKDRKTVLIDCADGMKSVEQVVAPALWQKGVRTIDVLLLTKPGTSRGIRFLFDNFDIRLLVAPQVPSRSEEHIRVLQFLQDYNCEYTGILGGDRISLDEVEFVFHYPTPDLVEFATVFELNYGDLSILWWGKGVHGASKLNFHRCYDIAKFDSRAHPEVQTDLAVYESPRDAAVHSCDELVFTKNGAVSISSDGDGFWVERVPLPPSRVSQ